MKGIYEKYVKPLPTADRLRLLDMTVHDLALIAQQEPKNRSILELHGLASIRKKQQRGDAIKPSETGRYRRMERRFFPSRPVTWCILVISLLIAFIK